MQPFLFAAALVAVIVAVAHSVIGEILIFKKLRSSGVVPTNPAPPLQSRNVRILWATWHLASVFGIALASVLYALSNHSKSIEVVALNASIFAFLGGALLVLVATNGKHPGWIGLLAAAVLAYLGQAS